MAGSLAKRRRNPGERAKLPASQLTAGQRLERKRLATVKADNANPLYDPSAPLTGHALAVAAKRITDAQINPQVAGLERANTNAKTQGTALIGNVGGYYHQLAGEEGANLARQQAITDRLNAATKAVGDQAASRVDDSAKRAAADTAADVGVRGGGLDGGADTRLAETLADARARTTENAQAAGNYSAQTGATNEREAAARADIAPLRGGEAVTRLATQLANQLGEGRSKIADVEGTRGGKLVENTQSLGQSRFENQVTVKGLNLKAEDLQASAAAEKAKLKADAAEARRRAAEARRSDDTRRRGQDIGQSNAQARADAAAAKARASESKAEAKRVAGVREKAGKAWGDVERATAIISAGFTKPNKKGDPVKTTSTADAKRSLLAQKVPPWAIEAAISIRHHGYIDEKTEALIRMSAPQVRIPSKYRKPAPQSLKNRPPGRANP